MNLQDIEAFVAVAETGSVNRAAIRLNLTQPATTRRIQSFEAAMGQPALFDRSVKPAALTSLGRHVLEHCRRVLAAVAELEASSAKAANPAGTLRIGVAHGFGGMVLTAPLDGLRRSFPRLQLQVSSDWTTELIERVRSGALDLAVGLMTDAHSLPGGLTRIDLGDEQVVVVAGPRPLARLPEGRCRLRDLADEGWFLNPPGCGCRAALMRAFDRLQLPVKVEAEVFGEDLQLSLLAHGGGLGLVPRRQFEASPHRVDLRTLDVADFDLPATVALVRPRAPGRFDRAVDCLAGQLRATLTVHHCGA